MSAEAPAEYRERELKFDVAPDWVLPRLDAVVPEGAALRSETVRLSTTYYDTGTGDLLASRITLRRRTGDTDEGWQLKVPDGDARIEVRAELNGRGVPRALAELVKGVRAGSALSWTATLNTERVRHTVVDAAGTPLLEIAEDTVRAYIRRGPVASRRWREVEIEVLDGGDEALLASFGSALTDGGATPSTSSSKLARALGDEAREARPPRGIADLVTDYIGAQVMAIHQRDIDLRRGLDVVHPARIATRRLRSVLRIWSDVFDADRAQHLDTELKWYAGVLGAVRDLEVLRQRLDATVDALPAEAVIGPVRTRIDTMLAHDKDAAQQTLTRTMSGARYLALIRELREWRLATPWRDGRPPAGSPAHDVTAAVGAVRTKLKKAAKHRHHEEHLHSARKAAKRARYAAELAEPRIGKRARKTVAWAKEVQDYLGSIQDSRVAAEFLTRAARAAEQAGESGFSYGVLHEQERAAADAAAKRARKKLT